MSGQIDRARLRDPALHPIADKVEREERLSPEDGIALYGTADLLGLGLLADVVNRRRNGDRVFFSANQHINPTNVCILRNTCTFCSFARMPKEEGAYTRSLDEVFQEAAQAAGMRVVALTTSFQAAHFDGLAVPPSLVCCDFEEFLGMPPG